MMELHENGIYLVDGRLSETAPCTQTEGKKKTMAAKIIAAHDIGNDDDVMHVKFDSLTSHDITYVGIIQTARASGLKKFPVPYVLTNCHNTLCAVGGTINEDDHRFALRAHDLGIGFTYALWGTRYDGRGRRRRRTCQAAFAAHV